MMILDYFVVIESFVRRWPKPRKDIFAHFNNKLPDGRKKTLDNDDVFFDYCAL